MPSDTTFRCPSHRPGGVMSEQRMRQRLSWVFRATITHSRATKRRQLPRAVEIVASCWRKKKKKKNTWWSRQATTRWKHAGLEPCGARRQRSRAPGVCQCSAPCGKMQSCANQPERVTATQPNVGCAASRIYLPTNRGTSQLSSRNLSRFTSCAQGRSVTSFAPSASSVAPHGLRREDDRSIHS